MYELFIKSAVHFLISCIIFTILIFWMLKSKIAFSARDQRGHLKKKLSLKSILTLSLFSLSISICLFLYDYFLFGLNKDSILELFFINLLMLVLLTIYDSLVIDLLIIGKIRPEFLELPSEMNMESMKEHVLKTVYTSWIFTIPIAGASVLIYFIVKMIRTI